MASPNQRCHAATEHSSIPTTTMAITAPAMTWWRNDDLLGSHSSQSSSISPSGTLKSTSDSIAPATDTPTLPPQNKTPTRCHRRWSRETPPNGCSLRTRAENDYPRNAYKKQKKKSNGSRTAGSPPLAPPTTQIQQQYFSLGIRPKRGQCEDNRKPVEKKLKHDDHLKKIRG